MYNNQKYRLHCNIYSFIMFLHKTGSYNDIDVDAPYDGDCYITNKNTVPDQKLKILRFVILQKPDSCHTQKIIVGINAVSHRILEETSIDYTKIRHIEVFRKHKSFYFPSMIYLDSDSKIFSSFISWEELDCFIQKKNNEMKLSDLRKDIKPEMLRWNLHRFIKST